MGTKLAIAEATGDAVGKLLRRKRGESLKLFRSFDFKASLSAEERVRTLSQRVTHYILSMILVVPTGILREAFCYGKMWHPKCY
jgi:hypothetical protein